MKKLIKSAFMVCALLITFSCSKEKEIEKTNVEVVQELGVPELKSYLSKLINVKIEEIGYNVKTEQFSIGGIDQISKQELTESYKRSTK